MFGYKDVKTLGVQRRRAALDAAAKNLSWLYLIRKLNALYVFNKIRHVRLAAIFKADRDYASLRHRMLRMALMGFPTSTKRLRYFRR